MISKITMLSLRAPSKPYTHTILLLMLYLYIFICENNRTLEVFQYKTGVLVYI